MADTKELKRIKKIYGERFKNLCRDMFPDILEKEGTLLPILEKFFSHNCNSLYQSITENSLTTNFRDLIYSRLEEKAEQKEQTVEVTKTPYEILDEAGYNLYECKTEKDIQSFRKYYDPSEVLCTIYNGGRLATRDCFFAVRKDVDEIRRENFTNPEKQDAYSTSVLGIQFIRDKSTRVQIISRYNHAVANPNCTLDNDLDKLAFGLKQSFGNLLRERGMELDQSQSDGNFFGIPGYALANDGKYYKYNMEVNGVYYCPNNIIIAEAGPKTAIAPEKGIIIDNFCLDLENKKIERIDTRVPDSFVDDLKDIERIEVEKAEEKGRTIKIYLKEKEMPVIIGINEDNQIVKYENQYVRYVKDKFLRHNTALTELNLPQLQKAGKGFLSSNISLTELNLPQLRKVGNGFLAANVSLKELNLPQLQEVGNDFLYYNTALTKLNLPQLQYVDNCFLYKNNAMTELDLPQLQQVKDCFLTCNTTLMELRLPQLRKTNSNFLGDNTALTKLDLPRLQQAGDNFLRNNTALMKLNLPQLHQAGYEFLHENISLTELSLPQLRQAKSGFLAENQTLTRLDLPLLHKAKGRFLTSNTSITELNLPQMPDLKREILGKNKDMKNTIESTDIAKLDRKSWLTRFEITSAKKIIEKLKEKFLGKKDKEDKDSDR